METSARIVIQQCLAATLRLNPESEVSEAEYAKIKQGMVVFVCFLKGANKELVEKMVKQVLAIKLCEGKDGKLTSITDLPGDLLIIPQACLGGKLKGKSVQYHSIINKTDGSDLYRTFVELCTDSFQQNSAMQEAGCVVKSGVYGNRQVLNMETNGPFTHIVDF
ncbi:putative D-tyrosyl-tRNA(Tyr) deacylase 2 [Lingula anatina]|uniref:D-aminoacyl-tRNA deacylase n=1 Tax=Lingula anatina TaxID=7574 RepID=A0A1S3HKC5_LINAN|nr:putative D-tyrosyl-tRNA(Tyr) deacylase 2 [Lingula anatina]|eukprot:XP_013386477.1 putative D-tyrosyl-tRNA(Tyr) deacylase 2 [Lingula anatina]